MLGERIQALRKSRRLTQAALGTLMGVTAAAVYKWEQNIAVPELPILKQLAQLFGVTLDELVADAALPPQDEQTTANIAVMARALRQLTPAEQEKLLAVGRTLFQQAFGADDSSHGKR